jgi:site-specific DNA recombinase
MIFYIGILRYSAQGHEPIVVHDIIPPIIDKELWDRVQYRHSRQKDVRPRKRKDLYALTGKIKCANCGSHYFGIRSGSTQNGKKYDYKYYVCSQSKDYHTCSCKRIRKDYLEGITMREIKRHILNEKSIYSIANEMLKILGENPTEQKSKLKQLKSRSSSLKSEMKELIDLRAKKIVSDSFLAEHIKEKETELQEIEQQIYNIERQTKSTLTHSMIVDYLNKMLSISDDTDDEVLKTIFDKFVDSIVVSDESIDITLIVSPHGDLEYNASLRQPKLSYYSKINR